MQYRDGHGKFIGFSDNTISFISTLNELMKKPLDQVTGEEMRWMRQVISERPAWAIPTLDRLMNEPCR